MKFRTEIELPIFPFKISYEDRILFIGSCFSDNIGRFFEESGFNVSVNPFGTLFNPVSIANSLKMALNPSLFDEDKFLVFQDGLWHSYAHHGRFSNPDRNLLVKAVNETSVVTGEFLKNADWLFVTFGTSFVYRLKSKDFIVANCHKVPATEFLKELLDIQTVVGEYQKLLTMLRAENPSLKVVFTVSPVRHLADGFHRNQVSKSILHLAIEQLLDDMTFYFPSYEIFVDDLRDYRFFSADLCHPSDAGVAYLQEKLIETFFSAETEAKRKLIVKENRIKLHRPNR